MVPLYLRTPHNLMEGKILQEEWTEIYLQEMSHEIVANVYQCHDLICSFRVIQRFLTYPEFNTHVLGHTG